MSKLINFNKISKIYKDGKKHARLLCNNLVIWGKEIISSCFGSGFWVNNKPWTNNVGWKNHN